MDLPLDLGLRDLTNPSTTFLPISLTSSTPSSIFICMSFLSQNFLRYPNSPTYILPVAVENNLIFPSHILLRYAGINLWPGTSKVK